MDYNKIIRGLFVFAAALSGMVLQACDPEFETPLTNEDKYETDKAYAYLKNGVSPNQSIIDLYQEEVTVYVSANITKPQNKAVTIKIKPDPEYVAAYNEQADTEYEMFPENLISMEEDGTVIVPPGANAASYSIGLKLKPGASLKAGETYMFPVSIESVSDGVEVKKDQGSYRFFVKAQGERVSAAKEQDIKVVWCIETNDANPLNAVELKLKDSNKPLLDMVILFSANINYDANEKRVFLHRNNSISAILDGREKYLKPLQDRGIKVLLGVMGNHDRAGVSNLSDDTARKFAEELRLCCEAYDLDGVFFDDEWTDYTAPLIPGFVESSTRAAARLVYETKMAMPDKLVTVFEYNNMTGFYWTVDGVNPGDFIDYAMPNYGSNGNPNSYVGISKKQLGAKSSELNAGMSLIGADEFRELYKEGYGLHMIFAMNPFPHKDRLTWDDQLKQMNNVAQGFYDDELVWSGKKHAKEW